MFSLSRPQEKAHENREVPLRALAASLGLHALVLGALLAIPPFELAGVTPATPLRAMLQPVGEVVEPVVASPPAPAASRTPVAKVVKPVASAPGAVTPELTFAFGNQITPVATPPGGVPAARSTHAPATAALSAETSEQGLDAVGLRQYRLSLASEARRYRNYPDAARRDGIAGTAEVRVSVSEGALRQAELARSSGHAVLDTAALEMLRAAATHARVPDSLRGQTFAVLLPVVFNVEE